MGLFSRPESSRTPVVSEEQVNGLITKFQGWVPNDFSKENLVKFATLNEDVQLLQFVGKNCAGMSGSMNDESIESIAQWLFDGTVVSLELRKKYESQSKVLKDITAIGLASFSIAESLPKYKDVLEYMRTHANKLSR
jgi:hypothetical protein